MLDDKLLEILACPVCKGPLRLEEGSLVCTRTGVRYPIEDDIPILLADRAEPPHPGDTPPAEDPSR